MYLWGFCNGQIIRICMRPHKLCVTEIFVMGVTRFGNVLWNEGVWKVTPISKFLKLQLNNRASLFLTVPPLHQGGQLPGAYCSLCPGAVCELTCLQSLFPNQSNAPWKQDLHIALPAIICPLQTVSGGSGSVFQACEWIDNRIPHIPFLHLLF